jgi:2-polyprenyl-3-methyl-5-hydroxy-6-metoxy-1,4-benzoquinol methylase
MLAPEEGNGTGNGNGNGNDNVNGSRRFIYDAEYFDSWNLAPGSPAWKLREATAAMRLDTLERLGVRGGSLLDVGAAGGYLVERATRAGFDARGVEISEHAVAVASRVVPGRVHQGTLETLELEPGSLHVVTLFDVLEHLPDPGDALRRLSQWLEPGGWLAVTTPDVESLSARLMAGAWPHYKEEHLFYPSRRGLRMLLHSTGYEIRHQERARKYLSIAFTAPLFTRYPVPVITPAMELLHRWLPAALRDAPFKLSIGERLLVGQKA